MMLGAGVELFHAEVPAELVGKTLSESAIGARTGLNVIAVVAAGETVANPPATLALPANGELLMVGVHEQRLEFFKTFG
jgi:voltage-gated potassium channel